MLEASVLARTRISAKPEIGLNVKIESIKFLDHSMIGESTVLTP